MKNRIPFLWIFPFFSFLGGYAFMSYWYPVPTLQAPHIIGLTLHDALLALSPMNINLHIINQVEESLFPPGTVINQYPSSNTKVKAGQTIFCSISKQPEQKLTPSLMGLSQSNIDALLKTHNMSQKKFYIPHAKYPAHSCIAQFPHAHKLYTEKHIITYLASDETKPIIWPNFKGLPLAEVQLFLAKYRIVPKVTTGSYYEPTTKALVVDQRPLPGSLIELDPNNPLFVHLHVQEEL